MKGWYTTMAYSKFAKRYDFETEKKKIHEIEVLETWTGGKQIYKRGESI